MEPTFKSRLKVKVGIHEFEAEGETESVQMQYREFQKMIANQATTPIQEEPKPPAPPAIANGTNGTRIIVVPLEKILKVEDRIVSMTAHTRSVPDALLIIMLGQKNLRASELVTGAQLADGLRTSGHQVSRVDYAMDKLVEDGYVIKVGAHRATRYRLTNTGVTKAIELAKELVAVVS